MKEKDESAYRKYSIIRDNLNQFTLNIQPYVREKAKIRQLETKVRVEIYGTDDAIKRPVVVTTELSKDMQRYDELLDRLIELERQRLIGIIDYTLGHDHDRQLP